MPRSLTPREKQVAKLIVKGEPNKGIATALSVSEGTVKIYVSHILGKLDLQNRTQIAVWYLKGNA